MYKKYAERFLDFFREINFKKIHRWGIGLFSIIGLLLLLLTLVIDIEIDRAPETVLSDNLPFAKPFHLNSGEYRIVAVNMAEKEYPILLVAPINGGVVLAAKPAKGFVPSSILENFDAYKLKVSKQGSWMFYSYQDALSGHTDKEKEDCFYGE